MFLLGRRYQQEVNNHRLESACFSVLGVLTRVLLVLGAPIHRPRQWGGQRQVVRGTLLAQNIVRVFELLLQPLVRK